METQEKILTVPTSWHDISLRQYIAFMTADDITDELTILCSTDPKTIHGMDVEDVERLKGMLDWLYDAPELDWQKVMDSMAHTPRHRPLTDMTVKEFEILQEETSKDEPSLERLSSLLFEKGDPLDARMSEVLALSTRLGLEAAFLLDKNGSGGDFSELDQ